MVESDADLHEFSLRHESLKMVERIIETNTFEGSFIVGVSLTMYYTV